MHPANESFFPAGRGNTVTIAASAAAAEAILPDRNRDENRQLQVANSTASWAFIRQNTAPTGTNNNIAAVADVDYPVAPGSVVVITLLNDCTYISAILTAGTGKIYLNIGEGV